MSLIPHEDLVRANDCYLREHPQPKTKGEILLEVYRDFPDATVAELSEASGRTPRWVRKTLRAAGITMPKQQRRKETKP
jgi:hypothetical protein